MSELIPVVNVDDEIIGYKARTDITKDDIYRVSALWIENSKGEILLAQRGFLKSVDPGKWGAAVAGTVEKGESYEDNISKEAEEELGIIGAECIVDKNIFTTTETRRFFCQYFILKIDKDISEFCLEYPQVESVRWFTIEELRNICIYSPNILVEQDFLSTRLLH